MNGLENYTICLDCPFNCLKGIFTDDDLLLIDQNKSELDFGSGETVIKQGTYISQVVYLKSGLAKIVLESKNKRNVILNLVRGKNFILLPVLGSSDQYPFSIYSLCDCTVCIIRKETFLQVMQRNININRHLLDWYSKDYQFLYTKLLTTSTRNSHGKLASALLYLLDGGFGDNILELVSRKDLAELAAISIESSNKILAQLKHDRIIDITKNGIKIKRRDLIEKLSTVG